MVFLRLAGRWIAGPELEDAVARAEKANRSGIAALIDVLGEHIRNPEVAGKYAIEYLKVLRAIRNRKLNAGLSVKLSQLGLDISSGFCLENIAKIVSHAKRQGTVVWIDMEGSAYTERTIGIYLSLLKDFNNIALTIQANLKRSMDDVQEILDKKGKIRLVKGAYREDKSIAYAGKDELRQSFSEIMEMLFESARFFAIATHDKELVERAIGLSRKHYKKFQFQFLMGMGGYMKLRLAGSGYDVAEYIPYGEKWAPYLWRRLRENRRAIPLALRSLMERDI